jgi:hypothetical protein
MSHSAFRYHYDSAGGKVRVKLTDSMVKENVSETKI